MKRRKSVLVILAILLGISGCSSSPLTVQQSKQTGLEKIDKPQVSNEDKLYQAINVSGVELLQKISRENENKNTIFSPASLATALAVLGNGSSGETKAEIDRIINPEQLTREQLNEKFCNLLNYLNNSGYEENGGKTTILELDNSIWIHEKLPVKEAFLNTSNAYYDTEIFNVDFADSNIKDSINQWISGKTHGKICNHISEINPLTLMYIFNSLYFQGKWESEFSKSKTEKEDFRLKNNTSVKVDMMNAEKTINYYEDDSVQAGEFMYYGCSMTVILPKSGIEQYTDNLSYDALKQIYAGLNSTKVKVKFPKFSFSQKNKLSNYLNAMGLTSMFDPDTADFTGISDNSAGFSLYVDDVSQECSISVDEEGTEAAALTSVALCGGAAMSEQAAPPEFYINRPFLFVIRDNRTDLILFIGKVENPLENS